MIIKLNPESIPYDKNIIALCKTPYYGHTKGCPNFGKKNGCPPSKTIDKFFNFNEDIFLIYTKFKIGKFAEKMRLSHPEWIENIYSYQENNYVKNLIEKIKLNHPNWSEEYFPEKNNNEWFSSRQWYNPRRWQPTARKEHNLELENFLTKYPDFMIDRCPEAHGINLTGLMAQLEIKLNWDWPPEHNLNNCSYIISLAGKLIL